MTPTSALSCSGIRIREVLCARVVAVVGARTVDDSMGLRTMSTLSGGPVYAGNIDPHEIPGVAALGCTKYARLTNTPEPVDVIVGAVPRRPGRPPGRHDDRPGRCVDVHGRLCGNRGRGRAATPTDDHDHGACGQPGALSSTSCPASQSAPARPTLGRCAYFNACDGTARPGCALAM